MQDKAPQCGALSFHPSQIRHSSNTLAATRADTLTVHLVHMLTLSHKVTAITSFKNGKYMPIIIKPGAGDFEEIARRANVDAEERKNDRILSGAGHNNRRAGATLSPSTMEKIAWPEAPFGFDHANKTSQLAAYILEGLQGERSLELKESDFWTLRLAATLHDVGRRGPWHATDPGHARRSAAIAEELLRTDETLWAYKERHEEVCRLIANHSLRPLTIEGSTARRADEGSGSGGGRWAPPTGPLEVALHDADAFEAARLEPGTPRGLAILRARLEDVQSNWAKNVEHQRRWRAMYKW